MYANVLVSSSADVTTETSGCLPALPADARTVSFGASESASGLDGVITIGGALSLTAGDKYYSFGTMILRSLQVFAEYVNLERGGLVVGGRKYGVRFVFVDDASSKQQVTNATANALREPWRADFAWGPYSSGLNTFAVQQSFADGVLTVNSGSSYTSVYEQNNLTFGMLPSSTTYLLPVFEMLVKAAEESGTPLGAFKMGCIGDNTGHMEQCAQVAGLAAQAGISVNADYASLQKRVTKNSVDVDELKTALEPLINAGVTILVSTGYNTTQWTLVQAMMALDYTPLAAVCTVSYIPSWEGEYLFHPSAWSADRPVRGTWSGLTSSEFASRFASKFGADAPLSYQGAGAFGGAAALSAAVEAAGTLDSETVARRLYSMRFDEFYGNFTFSALGQAQIPFLMLQHLHATRASAIVWPPSEVSSGTRLEFPMPPWKQRYCRVYGPGTSFVSPGAAALSLECSGHGTCNGAGACECTGGYSGVSCSTSPDGPAGPGSQPSGAHDSSELAGWRLFGIFAIVGILLACVYSVVKTSCLRPQVNPLLTHHDMQLKLAYESGGQELSHADGGGKVIAASQI